MPKKKTPPIRFPSREFKGFALGHIIILDRTLDKRMKKENLIDLGPDYVAVLVETVHELEEEFRNLDVQNFGLKSPDNRSH